MIAAALLAAATALTNAAATQAVMANGQAEQQRHVAVEPALSDGRLIVKIAAQNRSAAPVPFGPANVTIARLAAWRSRPAHWPG